jgi:hypothetical protein
MSAAKKKIVAKIADVVTLKALCAELKMAPRAVRIKLRAAEFKKDGTWAWKQGSAELTKVRKLLTE